jgi:hypothetical protein
MESAPEVSHSDVEQEMYRTEDVDLVIPFDGLKTDFANDESASDESDRGEESEPEYLKDEAFGEALARMAVKDAADEDWIPARLRKEAGTRAARKKSL